MRCEDFEGRLNEALDERGSLWSAPELAEHARQCGVCREVARAYDAMLLGLSYEELPPAPAWLAERVVKEALSRRPADRMTASRFVRLPAFALAASVLLAAGVVWWIDSHQLPNDVGAGDGEVQVAQATNEQKSERQAAPEMKIKAVPLMNDIAANSKDASEADNTLGILPAADWAPAGAEWAQEVADGLQPVTRPTVGAISGFLNLWGFAEEGRPS